MAGFAARNSPATGCHDPLTVRALAIGDTAVVVADVIGLHEDVSRRIRERCALPVDNVVVSALHNHGGPVTIDGRTGGGASSAYLQHLEDACVTAIDRAAAEQQPAEIEIGSGADPDVARNRRHPGGTVDRSLPVMLVRRADGDPICIVTSYACHPVVLGPDNLLWTADYPHFVRKGLEAAFPGALAIFLMGCCGDANSGHTAQASLSLAGHPDRTYAAAKRIGSRIADAALRGELAPASGPVAAASEELALSFAWREGRRPGELAQMWKAEADANPARAALLGHWIRWAETLSDPHAEPWTARVAALRWGGVPVVALPGEIFAETGLAIRAHLGQMPAFVISYSNGNPGYIPPASEFRFGGYEVDEAHRYCGLPATFAPGSAEALAGAAIRLVDRLGRGVWYRMAERGGI